MEDAAPRIRAAREAATLKGVPLAIHARVDLCQQHIGDGESRFAETGRYVDETRRLDRWRQKKGPTVLAIVDERGEPYMTEESSFEVKLEQEQDYRFKLEFDWDHVAPLLLDSAPPLGHAVGPDAERVLAGAAAYCLTASLLFCMRKFKQSPGKLRTEMSGTLVRNEKGRLRVGKLVARIHLSDDVEQIAHFDRCAQQFEDFCVVTDSIRHGIPVLVEIVDATGRTVYAGEAARKVSDPK